MHLGRGQARSMPGENAWADGRFCLAGNDMRSLRKDTGLRREIGWYDRCHPVAPRNTNVFSPVNISMKREEALFLYCVLFSVFGCLPPSVFYQ